MRRNPQRRGVLLVGVVLLMAIVLGLLSTLALTSGQLFRQRRTDQLQTVARTLVDSGTAYARERFVPTPAPLPAEPVELDVNALLPDSIRGALRVSFTTENGRTICRVTAQVQSGSLEAQDSRDIACAAR